MTRRELFEKAHAQVKSNQQQSLMEMNARRQDILKIEPKIAIIENILQQTTAKLAMQYLQTADKFGGMQKIMDENIHLQEDISRLLQQHGYASDALDVHYRCALCKDTGYVKGDHCSCVRELVKKMSASDLNQSTTMALETFDTFSLNYYQKTQQEAQIMAQILRFCKEYADSFSRDSKSVLMTGTTGLGKTHLSLAIANVVLQKGFQVLYGSAQDFFGRIQNEYFNRNRVDTDTLNTLLQADLLILDDLGAEFESNFNTSTLYNIINSRMNAKKPTIINTNLSLQEIQSRYSDRIASRLLTVYSGLRFIGTDVRQQQYLKRKEQ